MNLGIYRRFQLLSLKKPQVKQYDEAVAHNVEGNDKDWRERCVRRVVICAPVSG